jgi:cytochrome P450
LEIGFMPSGTCDGKAQSTVSSAGQWEIITSYREAEEILRRSSEFLAEGGRGVEAAEFVHDTLIDLDGRDHLMHRRLLTRVTASARIRHYQSEMLDTSVDDCLDACRQASADSRPVALNLVDLARRVFWQLGAQIIGIDDVTEPEAVELLERTVLPFGEAAVVLFSLKDHDTVVRAARDAKEEFRRIFYEPSRNRRQNLLTESSSETEVPDDVLSTMLRAYPNPSDDDFVLRQCMHILSATVSNTVATTSHTIAELERWLQLHPEDRPMATSEEFLSQVVAETIRMHRTGSPFLLRVTSTEIELTASGRRIAAGTTVALDLRIVSKDPEIFGDDAGIFNPKREISGARIKGYGLGFGSGPHVCLGKPMIVDDSGRNGAGIVVRVVKRLLEAGLYIDPAHQAVREQHGGDRYTYFPVLLPA